MLEKDKENEVLIDGTNMSDEAVIEMCCD